MLTPLFRTIQRCLYFDATSTSGMRTWFALAALSLCASALIAMTWEWLGRGAGSIHLMTLSLLFFIGALLAFAKGVLSPHARIRVPPPAVNPDSKK